MSRGLTFHYQMYPI